MFLASESRDFLTIIVVALFVIVVALIIYYIITGKKKEKVESPNFETKNQVKEEPKINDDKIVPEVNNKIEPIFVEQDDSKENLSLEKKLEEEKTDASIQTLLNQMQHDLDNNSSNLSETISRYEDEEEETAIISYKELMKYKENREKGIVLEEKNKDEIKDVIKNDIKEPEEVKKFKRSEFISPIFGYNEDANITYREIKRPPRKENKALDEVKADSEVAEFEPKKEKIVEVDKNDKFLDSLVDFRHKLD